MLISGARTLSEFEKKHPDAKRALAAWESNLLAGDFRNFADIRRTFGSADVVGPWTIFDIRGNNYRLITTVDIVNQLCHVETILTHAQYDRRQWMRNLSTRENAYLGWGPFEHPTTVHVLRSETDYDRALSVITQLGKWGAAEGSHPQNPLLGLILSAVRAYEKVYHPRGQSSID
jgi:mRNA interferase HigB